MAYSRISHFKETLILSATFGLRNIRKSKSFDEKSLRLQNQDKNETWTYSRLKLKKADGSKS